MRLFRGWLLGAARASRSLDPATSQSCLPQPAGPATATATATKWLANPEVAGSRPAVAVSRAVLVPPSVVGAVAGAASAACATLLTQPADVIRTELVLQRLKDKAGGGRAPSAVFMRILRTRGPHALFVGTTTRLARRMLQQAFTWAVYEAVVLK
jgi:hypothetical protein